MTEYLSEHKNSESQWDVVVGVSGGKDSCAIVRRLIENHRVFTIGYYLFMYVMNLLHQKQDCIILTI